jgi:multidrug transporter EmrE-like cation transporter
MTLFMQTWGLIIIAAIVDVFSILIIKNRLNLLGPVKYSSLVEVISYCINVIKTPQTFFASVLLVLSPIFYGLALSKINLTLAYPLIVAFSAILLVITSYFYLGENITFKQILGTIFIIAGVFIIYFK